MSDSTEVQEHLENITEQGQAPKDQELVFDPETGELIVKKKGVYRNPDAVVADSITKDGFF